MPDDKGKLKLWADDPTPLSARAGWSLLPSRDSDPESMMRTSPTPFSSLFGLPLLIQRDRG